MATSRTGRFPAGALSLSFGAIAFPIHVWAIINLLAIIPAWLLRASVWELAGVISYPLVAALLESCILWGVFLGAGYLLPRPWLADKFVALSSALGWLLAIWAMIAQFFYEDILQWGLEQTIPALFLIFFTLGVVYWLVRRYSRLEGWIKRIAQGLATLTYVYLVFDLLGVAVVIIRNF